ncbi:pyridoxamine 5'-phosphate oxidase family protein [Fodinicola acaciae]|uniref:pyridoxamine 5'-phosphate oxidase family protein n=1 Tax=Fodinicola acaciae TaxID=2681555 RepID=UPI0013CFCFE7|nr:pyridoxamine 5'-phosphate oxidase family protein [Fodinicola acaciae]
MYDAAGMEMLDRAECLRLLSTVKVGRVVAGGRIRPVNFAVHGDFLLIRTVSGPTLAAMLRSAVEFEADQLLDGPHRGWSVIVSGRAEEITDPRALAAYPWTEPWTPNPRDRYVRVSIDDISGRRIRPPATGDVSRPAHWRRQSVFDADFF